MRELLLCAIILTSNAVSGQNFGVDTNQITFHGHPDSLEFNDGFIVQNYSGQYLSMAWQRYAEVLPPGWEASICDGVACRPPEIDFALYELDTIWNSALNIMHMYYYPNGVAGTGTTQLKVFQWDTTASDTIYLTFHGVAIGSLGSQEIPHIVVKAYPNPAQDMVSILLHEQTFVRALGLIDMNGAYHAMDYSMADRTIQFQIPELAPGKYLVQIDHEKGRTIVPMMKQ